MTKGRGLRWIAAFAAILALGFAILGLVNMHQKFDSLSDSRRAGPLWIASQLELEAHRFENKLTEFASALTDVTADDLRFRFDILWSRAAVAEKGQEGRPAAVDSSAFDAIKRYMTFLRDVDQSIQQLDETRRNEAAELYLRFSKYSEGLRSYTLAAKDEQANLDRAARLEFVGMSQNAIILGVILGFASMINAALFYLDSRHHRKISQNNSELAKRSEAAYHAKSEFISTVSHELRTPLTSIKGALAILDSGHAGIVADRAKSLISVALRNSNRLERLINDILDFEKLGMSKMNYQFETVALGDIIRTAIEANEAYRQDFEVSISADLPDRDIYVTGDPARLEQVLTNLISNALKFSNPGNNVNVKLSAGDSAQIAVEDHGVGIPDEFRSHVFERFSQADSSVTRRVGGSGLGLSITKAIVEAHDGTIRFESESGVGTTFFVDLPLAEQAHVHAVA